jgi:hypothetical protein
LDCRPGKVRPFPLIPWKGMTFSSFLIALGVANRREAKNGRPEGNPRH